MSASKNWGRLSEWAPNAHPLKCGNCATTDPKDPPLRLWEECDEDDKPELRFVLLCKRCSDILVEKHERLYEPRDRNAPAPGAMEICVDCAFRLKLRCTRTKRAGGPGVLITAPQPMRGFIDGSKYRGPFAYYATPPTACSAKEVPRA